MTVRKRATLFSWQMTYAKRLARSLRRNDVALLQLPTGSGKTAIALTVLKILGANGVIACPRKPGDEEFEWTDQLENEESKPWQRDLKDFQIDRHIYLCSHRELLAKNGLFSLRRRHWIKSRYRKRVLVIDEVHRTPRLLNFLKKERHLPVRIIFVSATPVNPVHLESIVENLTPEELDRLEDREIRLGYLRLYNAILSTAAPTARAKMAPREKLKSLDDVKNWLRQQVVRVLAPCPRPGEAKDHAPRKTRTGDLRLTCDKEPEEAILAAVARHADFQERLRHVTRPHQESPSMTVAERLALAGFDATARNSLPKGRHHNNVYADYKADRHFERVSVRSTARAMTYKLERLSEFLARYFQKAVGRKGRVLVFCKYRKTVNWVSRWLEATALGTESQPGWARRHALEAMEAADDMKLANIYHRRGGRRLVWDTESYSKPKTLRKPKTPRGERPLVTFFNERIRIRKDPRGLVLITSDRLSESVDLHKSCNVLIHFDLDWSPLRLIQRVGRLWRIKAFGQRKSDFRQPYRSKRPRPPSLPHVYHLRYPCSVDDEIHARLDRRWKRLAALGMGLDILSYRNCVGTELGKWGDEITTEPSSTI